jgi:hypothetical protein
MAWQIHQLAGHLGTYRKQWDALNAELFAAHPYYDSLFIEPLLKHFADGRERLCVHERNGVVDAMLIVTRLKRGVWSLFVPEQAQIAPILARHPADLRQLLSRLGRFTLGLECSYQDPENSPLSDSTSGLSMNVADHSRTIRVRIDSSFEAYWNARSSNLRKSIKRRARRVKDSGFTTHLACLEESAAMREAVERFGVLESAGWKGKDGTAVSIDNAQGQFYLDVMTGFAAAGRASVYALYFNDDVVAMQLALLSPGMLLLLKTSYDESRASFGPGRLLHYQLLEHEFARRRVGTVEFYTNADNDQAAWATHERPIRQYLVFRNRLIAAAYQVRKRMRRAKPRSAVTPIGNRGNQESPDD